MSICYSARAQRAPILLLKDKTMEDIFSIIRAKSRTLVSLTDAQLSDVIRDTASALEASTDVILAANAKDVERMDVNNPKRDRLLLTAERIVGMAADMRNVATLPSPLGIVQRERTLPNGLQLKRVSVPFGVIGVIYEARPNVTTDVFSLCLKAGSACVLKGGSDAEYSNHAIASVINSILVKHGLPSEVCTLLPADRQWTTELLNAVGKVDLIIPRGSRGLIDFVRDNARVPVIETGAGVCHCYVDKSADIEMAIPVIVNAKTRRVSVCNALDCLLVHRDRVDDLKRIEAALADKNVTLYHDASLCGTEFMDYKANIIVVDSLDEAIAHISRYGSGHSESILTRDEAAAERFCREVDAACVYVNAPTSFTDGAQFGLGAEIGISTQKLHARGPMALEEITTYKWLIRGNGQTRA